MRITIVGGTGFLGYHAILKFLEAGDQCTAIALPEENLEQWFPQACTLKFANVFTATEEELKELFSNTDALIYAIGPDDRVVPPYPAHEFYQKYLVEKCTQVLRVARDAGVHRAVVLNSYFVHFHEQFPKLHLASHHPYIQARVDQSQQAIAIGGESMAVMVLQLPYIFGTMPNRIPLYKDSLFKHIFSMNPIFFPKGGTNMISVEHVAEAIVGAVKYGIHGHKYLIGDENHTWKELIQTVLDTLQISKKIISIPWYLAALKGRSMQKAYLREGKEPGLNYTKIFKAIEAQYFYFDPTPSREALHYGSGGLQVAIEETVRACYPEKFF